MAKYQVWMKTGSTYPDTSATDKPCELGPQHDTEAAAEAWITDSGYYDTGNREYYAKYWVVEAD
jgi:hypothetical protein